MKKRFLLPIAFLMVTTLSAQPSASSSCANVALYGDMNRYCSIGIDDDLEHHGQLHFLTARQFSTPKYLMIFP